MASWHRRESDGALSLFIHAQPGARKSEVAGLHGEALKIRIAAPALEDRANEALLEFVAKRLGVPRRDVSLTLGAKSREKRVRIAAPSANPQKLWPGG